MLLSASLASACQCALLNSLCFHSHFSILPVAAREIQPGVEPSARPDAADAEVPGRVETLPREFRPRRFQVFGPAVPSPNAVHGQHGAPLVLLAAGSALAYSHKARFVHSLSFAFFLHLFVCLVAMV